MQSKRVERRRSARNEDAIWISRRGQQCFVNPAQCLGDIASQRAHVHRRQELVIGGDRTRSRAHRTTSLASVAQRTCLSLPAATVNPEDDCGGLAAVGPGCRELVFRGLRPPPRKKVVSAAMAKIGKGLSSAVAMVFMVEVGHVGRRKRLMLPHPSFCPVLLQKVEAMR